MAEIIEELKSLLIKVKEKSDNDIKKDKTMATLVPSLHGKIDGERVETVRDFIFLGSKITVNGDCSHKIKRHLLFGRKAMTILAY